MKNDIYWHTKLIFRHFLQSQKNIIEDLHPVREKRNIMDDLTILNKVKIKFGNPRKAHTLKLFNANIRRRPPPPITIFFMIN